MCDYTEWVRGFTSSVRSNLSLCISEGLWVSHPIKSGDFALDMVYCKASRVSTMLDARGAMSLKMWEGA